MTIKDWQLSAMNKKLEMKGFSSPIARSFFRECFDLLYENYDKWKPLYKDLPDKAQYVQDVLINTIDKITELEMIEESSPEGQDIDDVGLTDSDFSMMVVYKDPEKCTDNEHKSDLETFFHECVHCSNSGVFDEELYDDNEYLRYAVTEGEASFHVRFLFPPSTWARGAGIVTNPVKNISLNYERETSISYFVEAYLYESLNLIAGYDALHSLGRYSDMDTLRSVISKRYGKELENEIWNKTEQFLTFFNKEKGWESEETFETAVELQNLFLQCVKKDIRDLDVKKPDQIKKYMEVYRNYKLQVMPQITDDKDTPLTGSFLDTDETDELLIEKIVQSDAMHLSDDKELNKMALKAVLYTENKVIPDDYYFSYIPHNIFETTYEFVERDKDNKNKPCLYMEYEDYESEGFACFVFNDDGSFELKRADRDPQINEICHYDTIPYND